MDMMDIKEKVQQMVERLAQDKDLMEQFQREPVKAVEKVLGVDLPDDTVEKLVAGVKAKLAGDKLTGAADSLKKLFQ